MIDAGPVHVARSAAISALRDAGVSSPEHDGTDLLAHVLGVPRGLLALAPDLRVDQAQQLAALVRRRTRREPLQHITGSAGFYGLDIEVGPGVFIPRPETESLVELAIDAIRCVPAPTVIDLCSGSGAIAIAIARARPSAEVYAVELSEQSASWLRRNTAHLAPSVQIVQGDALDGSLPVPRRVDLVTCNPPYVPLGTVVAPEVAEHDPPSAVFSGGDGLELIAPLVARIGALLAPRGTVVLEHDDSHQDRVVSLFEQAGEYDEIAPLDDLTGRPRFVRAIRRR